VQAELARIGAELAGQYGPPEGEPAAVTLADRQAM
jgi:hypothetical protein